MFEKNVVFPDLCKIDWNVSVTFLLAFSSYGLRQNSKTFQELTSSFSSEFVQLIKIDIKVEERTFALFKTF